MRVAGLRDATDCEAALNTVEIGAGVKIAGCETT